MGMEHLARKVRIFFENTPLHILLQGINQEHIFNDQDDYLCGLEILKDLTKNLPIQLHAYILMPTHIHLLCTPFEKNAMSRFMQGFGIKYVAYFNKKYHRSGTLWEGRYKSSLVENRFILPLMKYIETSPVRANLVDTVDNYKYSSFSSNALGMIDAITTAHQMYELLGATSQERLSIYRSLFVAPLEEQMLTFVQNHIHKQTITGTEAFAQALRERIGSSSIIRKIGRPKKTNQQRNTMYQKLVILDKEQHKSLKVSPMSNLNFARELTSTPILANEIALVGKDFPVVFTGGENPTLMALTSLSGSNLAINADDKYIVSYVPAFLRRYPFSIGANKENPTQQLILIDENSDLLSHSKGKQLFTKEGENSETLNNAISFLQNYENERMTTQNVVNLIVNSGILEDREITVGEGEEKKVLVNGFRIINKDKLNALSDEVLAAWVRKGIISFIDAHISSLSNIQTLFNLASTKQ